MAHCNTIFSQILKLVPRHEFETLAKRHHCGRSFRTASRWSQFVTMSMAQLAGRNSLRDIVENISAQGHRLEETPGSGLTFDILKKHKRAPPKPLSNYVARYKDRGKVLV